MTLSEGLAFGTLLGFGPIPLWHLTLHGFLPFWRLRPRTFYVACLVEWILVGPLLFVLSCRSAMMFTPSGALQWACCGASLLALAVVVWSVSSLTPRRFFLWEVLRPSEEQSTVILTGLYRHIRHPAYMAIVIMVAAGFLASGRAVVLEALCVVAVLLSMVIGLEQRELEDRLGVAERRTKGPTRVAVPVPFLSSFPGRPEPSVPPDSGGSGPYRSE